MIDSIFLSVRRKTLLYCILFSLLVVLVSSLPNEDISSATVTEVTPENTDPYCTQETCEELRERVASLEEAVRAIVTALSSETRNQHEFKTKFGKNRAVQSVLSAASLSASDDVQEEENQPTETPSSSQAAEISISIFQLLFLLIKDIQLLQFIFCDTRSSSNPANSFKLGSSS